MSWREPKPRYQIGKWFLAQRGSVWYRCGYNSRTRQTERVSLSTRDFQEAQQRLAEFFIETYNPNKVSKASITLARALTIYYTEHGVNIPSHTSVKTHCEKLIDYWKDALLSDLSIREQRVFKAHLETLGCSEGYIQRIFTTLRAATNFCYKNEYIDQPVNIMSISVPMHNNVEMGRPLSLEEMARLFDAIELDYLMRYCLLMLGTLARPTAIMELHSLQLDHDYRLITLNPPGRKQTKKYRPTVKMPEFIHQATRHLADCNIISGSNVPIKSVKTSFATAIKKAELTGKVTGYSFRHTMTRWLRSQSVPPWEVAAQLGHRMEQYSTTEIYAPYDPSYLSNCVEAIEGYYNLLSERSEAGQSHIKIQQNQYNRMISN